MRIARMRAMTRMRMSLCQGIKTGVLSLTRMIMRWPMTRKTMRRVRAKMNLMVMTPLLNNHESIKQAIKALL